MKETALLSISLLMLAGLSSCIKDDPPPLPVRLPVAINAVFPDGQTDGEEETDTDDDDDIFSSPGIPVSDIDGNLYPTVRIGDQTWMAINLKAQRYNDGDTIILGTGAPAGYTDWFDCGDSSNNYANGAYCWFENDAEKYKDSYGAIYNWHAVETGRLCPAGWHVPSSSEWTTLINRLGGDKAAFAKLSAKADNIYGFNAYPAGELCGWGFIPNSCIYWSSTAGGGFSASVPYAYLVSFWVDRIIVASEPQSYGYNVRCMKDKPTEAN